MANAFNGPVRDASFVAVTLLAWQFGALPAAANPTGGSVAQGSANFNSSGSQMTITTGANTVINWQSFNIGVNDTTTFVEPSSTSVVWNHINDSNPSQILGTLNANGYVVLQNQNGFVVGGSAAINTHGLLMTTSPTPPPTLANGGAWQFDALPPTASIINYGQITVAGGPAFLIANTIDNYGTISAPQNQIGLYAGQQVLVSTSPDGRGISAKVTLPQGSVDNEGNMVADGGSILVQVQTVNQNGLVQANTVQNVNGVIELVASGNLTVGANSDIVVNNTSASANNSPSPSVALQAGNNLELSGSLALNDSATPASVSLSAGNSIILDSGTSLTAGENWTVNLVAGTAFAPTAAQPTPLSGSDGVYLNGGAYVQTQNGGTYVQTENGDINISAANEVIIQNVDPGAGGGAIRTLAGGNINVTAQYGDVNTGDNFNGYTFSKSTPLPTTPYYTVDAAALGGISTAAGGNVTINAGGDVTSYLPTLNDYQNNGSRYDGGTGAFGPEAGNVSITAGGSVFGNYVLANGTGTIIAGANAGTPVGGTSLDADFALSLIKGGWSVSAQNIYLDAVLNPNGVFNDSTGTKHSANAGYHYFDYDPNASLLLDAANAVEITGVEVPLQPASDPTTSPMPVILPPSLQIVTGAGGLTLDSDVILFPSPNQNLNLTTLDGGNFQSTQNPAEPIYSLVMSDSASHQFTTFGTLPNETFGIGDHAATPPELNNPNPVEINISGSMNDVNVYATKQTDLNVTGTEIDGSLVAGTGNMFNSSLIAENLHASDVTSINVAGNISFSPIYTLTGLGAALPTDWQSVFSEIVDTSSGDPNYIGNPIPSSDIGNSKALKSLYISDLLFPSGNPGFVYNPTTLQLGYAFQMSSLVSSTFAGTTLTTVEVDSTGTPVVQQAKNGSWYFVTTTVNNPLSTTAVKNLYYESLGENLNGTPSGLASVVDAQHLPAGFQLGGPGQFDVTVGGTLDLGASAGIISWGGANGTQASGGVNYASSAALTDNAGAAINVNVAGNLSMLTSTIASVNGGSVNVNSGGEINLGEPSLPFSPPNSGNIAFGIYTAGAGDVSVTAQKDINVDTARIGTFNGGSVFVESYNGDVNAGDGANLVLEVPFFLYDPATGAPVPLANGPIQGPWPYGSGILAISPTEPYQVAPGSVKGGAELPGNITVETPNGNIVSTLGGIAQFALNANVAGGPTVNLTAGTPGVAASASEGNIELGQGGVLGGTVNLSAQGNISGLIVSRQNTTVTAVQNVDVTVLSGGNANVAAGGNVAGTLVGMTGVNASGAQGITATMLSSSVSANGASSQNTLGTATASAASQSAANQSGTEAKQELATSDSFSDDNKKKKQPLMQRVKRVTVLLPKS
jgi:filamentous hemagglutinin family protein